MNIAFPALLIILLVLPGIIFRYHYARGIWRWKSPVTIRPWTEELLYSVSFAIGLNAIWILLWQLFEILGFCDLLFGPCNLETALQSVLVFLTGFYGSANQYGDSAIASISVSSVVGISFYLLTLYTAALILGNSAHRLIRYLKLDLRWPLLRFGNEWYYVLTGEVLQFREEASPKRVPEVAGVYLTALMEQGGEAYIYRGIVRDFWFDRDGHLDKILLVLAHKRPASIDRPTTSNNGDSTSTDYEEEYYDIHGDYFLLKYSEAKTINVEYFALLKDLSGADLRRANLSDADLSCANLSKADLSEANLSGVNLRYANLEDAKGVTNEKLEHQVKSLEGTTMPTGEKYEDWLQSRREVVENNAFSVLLLLRLMRHHRNQQGQ